VRRSRSGVSCLNHLRLQVESSAETPCTSDARDVLPKVRVNLVVYASIVALGFKLQVLSCRFLVRRAGDRIDGGNHPPQR
jgi:hypothetical protein